MICIRTGWPQQPLTNEVSTLEQFDINTANFKVTIEGIELEQCTAVSSIDGRIEKLCRDDGTVSSPQYRKGRSQVDNVEFARIFRDRRIFDWFKECRDGSVVKRSISVVSMSDKGEEIVRFNFEGCWPIAWSAPSFNAGGDSDHAIETFTMAVESIEIP